MLTDFFPVGLRHHLLRRLGRRRVGIILLRFGKHMPGFRCQQPVGLPGDVLGHQLAQGVPAAAIVV